MYQAKTVFFDEHASAPWAVLPYGQNELQKLNQLFKHLGPLKRQKVLEPGCGTGRLTEILAERAGSSGKIVALDISPKMIEVARKRLAGKENVELHLTAIEDFQLERNMFDLILCHQVFPHFEDKQQVLSLFSGCLQPGGKLVVFHFISYAEINDYHRKAGTAVERDIMPESVEMERLLRRNGFKIEFFKNDKAGYFLCSSLTI